MTIVSSTLNRLSPTVASSFIPLLTFPLTLSTVLKAIGFCVISIFSIALILSERETSHFGAQALKGRARGFDNLYFCKESFIAFSLMAWASAGGVVFATLQPLGHSFGGFREHVT